jgi:hypothetical protein
MVHYLFGPRRLTDMWYHHWVHSHVPPLQALMTQPFNCSLMHHIMIILTACAIMVPMVSHLIVYISRPLPSYKWQPVLQYQRCSHQASMVNIAKQLEWIPRGYCRLLLTRLVTYQLLSISASGSIKLSLMLLKM